MMVKQSLGGVWYPEKLAPPPVIQDSPSAACETCGAKGCELTDNPALGLLECGECRKARRNGSGVVEMPYPQPLPVRG